MPRNHLHELGAWGKGRKVRRREGTSSAQSCKPSGSPYAFFPCNKCSRGPLLGGHPGGGPPGTLPLLAFLVFVSHSWWPRWAGCRAIPSVWTTGPPSGHPFPWSFALTTSPLAVVTSGVTSAWQLVSGPSWVLWTLGTTSCVAATLRTSSAR